MGLRLRLLILVALIVLIVADNIAAQEETKSEDGLGSTGIAANGKEKRKALKDEKPTDTDKVRMKQKWQRYKTPSSKKMKKADSWKEKAVGKSGKEKWKSGVEEASKQKKKRSTDYEKQLNHNRKGKWVNKDKTWKHDTKRDKRLQMNVELNVEENEFMKNKQMIGYNKKVKGKTVKKDKWKSDKSDGVCSKDELCSNDSKIGNVERNNLWKRKHSDEASSVPKPAQLRKTKYSNPEREVDDLNNGDEVRQHREGDVDTQKSEQSSEQDEANSVSEKTTGSKTKEETKLKTNENNNKKSQVSVSEQKENLSVEPEPQMKFSKSKGLKVQVLDNAVDILNAKENELMGDNKENKRRSQKIKRLYIVDEEFDPDYISNWADMKNVGVQARILRYIVEEEVVDDSAVGEVGESDSEIPQLMQ